MPGDRVRICSDLYQKVSCGVEGVVQRVHMGRVHCRTDQFAMHDVPLSAVRRCAELKTVGMKRLTLLSAADRHLWLVADGWQQDCIDEDSFAACAAHLHGDDPVMVSHRHLNLWWRFLEWSFDLQSGARKMQYVDPELFVVWCGATLEAEDLDALEKQWRVIRHCCSQEGSVVLVPICDGGHWTMLVIDHGMQACRYYDSLAVQVEAAHLKADYLLTQLKKEPLPHLQWLPAVCPSRGHGSRQGPLECGFFVGWWMEEECRAMLGEGFCSRGCPKPAGVRRSMEKLLLNLKPAAQKLRSDVEAVEKHTAQAEKDHDAAAAAAKLAGELGQASKSLQEKAMADMKAGVPGVPIEFPVDVDGDLAGDLAHWADQMVPLLLPAHQADVARVKVSGIGICSTCRWLSGCRHCDWPKTVRYWRNHEVRGAYLEGYSAAAKAKAKAKGKAKAEPKGKAKGKPKAKAKALLGGGPP